MLLCVALVTANVSEERISSIIRVTRIDELGSLAVTSNWSSLRRTTTTTITTAAAASSSSGSSSSSSGGGGGGSGGSSSSSSMFLPNADYSY
jgi:uncharacterized membrane protein